MEERLEEGFVREWAPCTRVLSLLPPRVHAGLFSTELRLTCVDAVSEYLALGTNVGLVYWYSRKKGTIERLRSEASQSIITCVKIVNTVDYMVAAGNTNGQVSVFQIPKELPDSVPDTLKPKTEPKVERYTIGELHNTQITAIEWSKNGMRLFSGDKNGVIIMTEIDFYMHLCKSVEIVNEQYEIVQISYHQNSLLVSSLFRTILCERRDARWEVNQVGKKERKSLMALGAVFQWSFARGGVGAGDVAAYCARPGLRLWRADKTADVHQTLLFKDAVANPMTVAELLNPSHARHSHANKEFGPLHVFRENFLLTHNDEILYILDPRSLTAVAVVDDLRRILSLSVNKDEIFILEGERSLVRLGHAPEIDSLNTGEDPLDLMTKSLSSSIQLAVSTVRELAQRGGGARPASPATPASPAARLPLADAEECFELPPIHKLPPDVRLDVLESMIDSFESEPVKTCIEDLQRKMKLYNTMADEELIYSSRRNRRRDTSGTPKSTPVKRIAEIKSEKVDCGEENGFNYSSNCNGATNYKIASADESEEEMHRQIEEKEKILAKMLNLDSLSIPSRQAQPPPHQNSPEHVPTALGDTPPVTSHRPTVTSHNLPVTSHNLPVTSHNPPVSHDQSLMSLKADAMTESYPALVQTAKRSDAKATKPLEDLIPKMAKVPQNWNLGSLQVAPGAGAEQVASRDRRLASPDGIEAEWEFV